jgi:hypothetical protein
MKKLLVCFMLLCALAPAQEKLVVHIRYNPTSPNVFDIVELHLVYGPISGTIVSTAGEFGNATVVVAPNTTPDILCNRLATMVNSAGMTGYQAKHIKQDVVEIHSPLPLKLAIRSTDTDPGVGFAYLVNFGLGVSHVSDGIANNGPSSACANINDFSILPYSGPGFCFLEHLDSSLLGEGNGRGIDIHTRLNGIGPYTSADKIILPNDTIDVRVYPLWPYNLLNEQFMLVAAPGLWYTSSFLSANLYGIPEFDLVGVNDAWFPLTGAPGNAIGTYPTTGLFGWTFTIPYTPMVWYIGLSLTLQAFAVDPSAPNGIAATRSIVHRVM